jgi:hypothetical protein
MGAADAILFALLALADFCLVFHLHRRRQRRRRSQRMMRMLRIAIRRETASARRAGRKASALVLQQTSKSFLTA